MPATIGVVPSLLKNLITTGEETVAVSVLSLQVVPPSVENWYLVIVDPPFDDGGETGTFICKLPTVGVPIVGTPGAMAEITDVASDHSVALGEIPLTAVTSTRINFPTNSIALAIKLEAVAPEISEQAVEVSVLLVQTFH